MRRYRADLKNSRGRSMGILEVTSPSASAAARQADRILAAWPGCRAVMTCLDEEVLTVTVPAAGQRLICAAAA